MGESDLAGEGAAIGLAIGFIVVMCVLSLVVSLFYFYCLGRIFRKAGEPLWTGFVPFYNLYIWTKIVGRPAWWLFLLIIPLVGNIVHVFLSIDLARSFNKDEVFGVLLLWLFGIIGIPILAFGDAEYAGPSVTQREAMAGAQS